MANAWLIPPMPAIGVEAFSSVQLGMPDFVLNDHRGVVAQVACNSDTVNQGGFKFDLGADREIDTIMVFGVSIFPSEGTLLVSFSTSAAPDVFSSTLGVPYAGVSRLETGGVSMASFDAPVTARHVVLHYVAGASMPGQAVQMSRVVIGKRLRLERNYSLGGNFGVRDLGSLDFSPRGVLLRRRSRKLRTAGLTFSSIHRDEVEKQTAPLLERIGNTEMVALVTDPDEHPDRQRRCYFGPLVGDLGHVQRRADGFEAKVNMVSIF